MQRPIALKPNTAIAQCPACQNNTHFTGEVAHLGDGLAMVWVVCICGYDPTVDLQNLRYEAKWGGTNDENIRHALSRWSRAISS